MGHRLIWAPQGDFVVYGVYGMPSASYWLIPGTQIED